jgi:ring-1,2-phenylacetyl-CoA epoxidase subunit PaaD
MPTLNLDEIRLELSEIPDPEIPVITIEELGVLRDVSIQGEELIITITPTYSGCPAMDRFQTDIKQKLKQMRIEQFKIILQYDPPWTTDWLNEKAKSKLKHYGIAPPVHKSTDKSVMTGANKTVPCPRCETTNTEMVSQFGSTACKSMYRCLSCLEPFEYFKCL